MLDKNQAKIQKCLYKDIRPIFEKYHYKKGTIGGGISVCFSLFINNVLVGGSVLGKPRHEKKYKNCIDIRRMACVDEAPQNSESFFIGQIAKYIKNETSYNYILSYSDLTENHIGTIYRATGFYQIGRTTPTKYVIWNGKRYHPRSLSIDRDYSYKLREDLKQGKAQIITGLPKIIWLKEIKRKTYKKLVLPTFSLQSPKKE